MSRQQKSSQEIMNEIEKLREMVKPTGDRYGNLKADRFLSLLQAQRQERLDCYKKELEFLDSFLINEDVNANECKVIHKRMSFLKQEIKILEGK